MRYQTRFDPSRLVFIDETWVKTNMAPLRGWSAHGKRLAGHALARSVLGAIDGKAAADLQSLTVPTLVERR
jgi:hypothetical protein